MRTLLGILMLFAFATYLPAQDFDGMAYVKAGGELIGPVKVKQNVGGSISIGQWPKTTFFVFDEYTAVLDENRNLLFEGGFPASGTPGEKFLAEKEKLINADPIPTQQPQEQVADVTEAETIDQPKPDKEKKVMSKKKKDDPKEEVAFLPEYSPSDTMAEYEANQFRSSRFGFGVTAGHFKAGGIDGCGYGLTVNRTYPVGQRFRIGGAVDAIVYHDFIFKKTMTQVFYDDMGYPVEEESYKFPEGFAGALQLRPFAGMDFGCLRAGYQPVLAVNYHSIWGTNVDVFPLGVGVGFLKGPIQVDVYAATELSRNMYYGRMRVFGVSVTYGNRTGGR